jgi:hypothetical protein
MSPFINRPVVNDYGKRENERLRIRFNRQAVYLRIYG